MIDPIDEPSKLELRVIIVMILMMFMMIAYSIHAEEAGAATKPALKRCEQIRGVHDRRACIIRSVFGPRHGARAVAVARCESGLNPNARNGQHLGVFQMGRRERARFGHGRTVLAQAIAARRYHAVSGWSPWTQCL